MEGRIYQEGNYEERSRYIGSLVVHIMGDESYVTLLTGAELDDEGCYAWTKSANSQIEEYLISQGVCWVNFECKGHKVRRNIVDK